MRGPWREPNKMLNNNRIPEEFPDGSYGASVDEALWLTDWYAKPTDATNLPEKLT